VINNSSTKNIVIVGGNAAGPAAAAKAKRTAPDASVMLFETGEDISTGTCELPYVLSGYIKNINDVIFFTPESFEREKGVKTYNFHRVESIDRKKKVVSVRNLKSNHLIEFGFNKLILCTGSLAKRLEVIPKHLKNVFTLKSVFDVVSIQKYIQENKSRNALIIGAGYIGLETAEALITLGLDVTIVEKEKYPMHGIEEEVQRLILETLKQNKIEFYGNTTIGKVNSNSERLISINIEGWQKQFDIVISAVGIEPNVSLAAAAQIQLGATGAIKVDQKLRTSDPNIFAAGDCIEMISFISGRPTYLPLATHARNGGHIAGENAAGGNAISQKVIRNIAIKIFDKNLVITGMCRDGLKKNNFNYSVVSAIVPNLVKVMPNSQQVFGKILFEKSTKHILGANFYGGDEVAGYGDIISTFIRNRIKGTELANLDFNYTPPLSPFIHLLSFLGRKIESEK
jgi:NADPH-dependent 2,4-dienoyl-CoA reductase/sulfur reductase-like enzyme